MARGPKRSSLDDVIARIQANAPGAIGKVKDQVAKAQSGKKGVKRKQIITDEDRIDAGFPTIAERALREQQRQQGIGSTAQPTAPMGTGQATRPIQAPQSAFATIQNAIAQVQANAQPYFMRNVAPPSMPMPSFGALSQQSPTGNGIPPSVAPTSILTGFSYARAPQKSRGLSIQSEDDPDKIRDNGIARQNAERKMEEKLDRQAQKAVDKFFRSASKKAVRLSRAVEQAGEVPIDVQDADDIGNRDAFERKTQRIGNARDKQQRQSAQKWDAMSFKINRIFHLINKVGTIGGMAQPDNLPGAQMGPIASTLSSVAPLLPGPIGIAAYAASEILHARIAGETMATSKTDAQNKMAMMHRGFGNRELASAIVHEAESSRLGAGLTYFEWLQDKASFKIGEKEFSFLGASEANAQAASNAGRTIDAMKVMREESFLYGANAQKALISYAAKHRMAIGEIPDQVRNKLIDDEMRKERNTISMSADFNEVLDRDTAQFQWGADVRNRKREEYLDAVVANPELANKLGLKSVKFDRQEAEIRIANWMENHSDKLHQDMESARNTDLKMKAERHRHLAEW